LSLKSTKKTCPQVLKMVKKKLLAGRPHTLQISHFDHIVSSTPFSIKVQSAMHIIAMVYIFHIRNVNSKWYSDVSLSANPVCNPNSVPQGLYSTYLYNSSYNAFIFRYLFG